MEIVGLDSPTTILQSYTQTIQDSHLTEIQEKTFIKLRETGQCLYFVKVLQIARLYPGQKLVIQS